MNVGVICDLEFSSSICFSNYFYAVKNIFKNVKLIKSIYDIEGIDLIVIGNDHFGPHQNIWNNDQFINSCNEQNIKIFVITAEFIHTTWHPHNITIQKSLEKFKNLYQRVVDIKDANTLNKKIISVGCSKYYEKKIAIPKIKQNKCVFFGKMYPHRAEQIDTLKKVIDVDVFSYNTSIDWKQYLTTLAQYRFVLSPQSGDSSAFPLRYYESLLVNSIPIQQIVDNSLNYYTKESSFKDVIYYTDISEIPLKIKNCNYTQCNSKIWIEDTLQEWLEENNIKINEQNNFN